MKKLFLFALVFFIAALFCQAAFAQESTRFESVPALGDSEPAAVPFGMEVKGDGRLLVKPGAVFTQGGHYEDITLPYLVSSPKTIAYPRWAMRQGWQGKVSIALEILRDGRVGRTKIMQSSGYRLLDQTAAKAVHTWRFHPAIQNGRPTVTCIQIPIVFQLENE